MHLTRKIALLWLKSRNKKAAPINPPPHMYQEAEEFMLGIYAGHVLAKTKTKIEHYQKTKLEEIELRKDRMHDAYNKLTDKVDRREEEMTFESVWPLVGGDQLLIKLKTGYDGYVLKYKWNRVKGRSTRWITKELYYSGDLMDTLWELRTRERDNYREEMRKVRRLKSNDEKIVDLIRLRDRAASLASREKTVKSKKSKQLPVNIKNWTYLNTEDPLQKRRQNVLDKAEEWREGIRQGKKDKARLEKWLETAEVGDQISFLKNTISKKGKRWTVQKRKDGSLYVPERDARYSGKMLMDAIDASMSVSKTRAETYEEMAEDITTPEDILDREGWDKIKIQLHFGGHKRRSGQWWPSKKRLQVDVYRTDPSSVKYFNKELENIRQTLWHEMRHVAQTLLSDIKNLDDRAGIGAPEQRTPDHDPDGYGKGRRLDHPLRDIEFEPRLGDEKRYFINRVEGKIQPEDYKIAFKMWTSQQVDPAEREAFEGKYGQKIYSREFFRKLKNNQPEKYREAVKELYKTVERAGLSLN